MSDGNDWVKIYNTYLRLHKNDTKTAKRLVVEFMQRESTITTAAAYQRLEHLLERDEIFAKKKLEKFGGDIEQDAQWDGVNTFKRRRNES